MHIRVKRIYEPPADDDGGRLLVDALWPRGVSKERAALAGWLREIAPSAELRKWFQHDDAKWAEFRTRYFEELVGNAEAVAKVAEFEQGGVVTLLFATANEEHNNAVALRDYLMQQS